MWNTCLLVNTVLPLLWEDPGIKIERKGGRPEASLEVLKDRVHAVNINLLDDLPKSSSEILDRFIFLLKDGLE